MIAHHQALRRRPVFHARPTEPDIEKRPRGFGSPQHNIEHRRQTIGCLHGVLGARAGDKDPKAPTTDSKAGPFVKGGPVLYRAGRIYSSTMLKKTVPEPNFLPRFRFKAL